MDSKKIGELIKKIRTEHNMTQNEFAKKYNVTYQAVSKWENGINIPDVQLIKQISKDYNINIEYLLEGTYKKNKSHKSLIILIIGLIVLSSLIIIFAINKNTSFSSKSLTTTCTDFIVKGNISYNQNKTAIYITSIEYCGEEWNNKYSKMQAVLYEKGPDNNITISTNDYEGDKITLEDFVKSTSFEVESYQKVCKDYNNLFIEVIVYENDNILNTFNIPLELKGNC